MMQKQTLVVKIISHYELTKFRFWYLNVSGHDIKDDAKIKPFLRLAEESNKDLKFLLLKLTYNDLRLIDFSPSKLPVDRYARNIKSLDYLITLFEKRVSQENDAKEAFDKFEVLKYDVPYDTKWSNL